MLECFSCFSEIVNLSQTQLIEDGIAMWMIVSDCVNGEDAIKEASEASVACTSKSLYACLENILYSKFLSSVSGG